MWLIMESESNSNIANPCKSFARKILSTSEKASRNGEN